MQKKKFPFPLLFLGIFFLGLTIYSVIKFPPDFTFQVSRLSLPLFPFVLMSTTISLFCIIGAVARSLIHGLVLSVCTLAYLLLRLFGLTSLFFLILLLALCVTLELFFLKKN